MLSPMPITVQVTGPDGASQAGVFSAESLLIGSGAEARVQVRDPRVASAHCLLRADEERRLVLVDLGSEAGTHLGGQRIGAPVRLKSGQSFTIGRSRVRVTFGDRRALRAPFEGPVDPADLPRERPTRVQVALLWGGLPVAMRELDRGTLTVGEGQGCDLFLAHPSVGPGLELVSCQRSGARIAVPAGVALRLTSPEGTLDRPALERQGRLEASRLELGAGEALRLDLGALTLVVRRIALRPPLAPTALDDQDFTFAKVAIAAVLVFLALGVTAVVTPVPEWATGDGEYVTPARYVKLVAPPARPPQLRGLVRLDAVRAKERAARRERQEERPRDRPVSPRATGTAPAKAELDRQKVGHLLAGLFGAGPGPAGLGVGGAGPQVDNALGGLKGPGGGGDGRGLGGLASRGALSGGLGGVGLGLGGSAGVGGRGPAAVDLGAGHPRERLTIIPGRTTVVGALDREVVARVIQSHQSEIKFCYESELQKDPSLAGKVSVAWTIDPTGAVVDAAVSESSMGNAAVEACLVARVRRWRFPEPQGGGVVAITYPWIFKAAGDGATEPAAGGAP
jgi:TonB family protein